MRIAYDAAPLLQPRTGVGHYTEWLLKGMLAIDPELEFKLFAITRANDLSVVPKSDRIVFKHLRIPARAAVTAWEVAGWPPWDGSLSSDLVHGTNFWVPPVRRTRAIVTIHDLTFKLFPEFCTPQVQRYEWIVPKVLSRCDLVITPSQTIRDQVIEELSFPEDRVRVTYEAVRETFRDAQEDPDLLRRLGINRTYVVFTGTQEPRKNLDRLLIAFDRLDSDLQLVIVGPPGWGSVNLPAVAHKLRMDRRVVFSGYLPDAMLGPLLKGAKAFVFPTLYEGFGLPPLEAMQLGIPVVASKAGALPEVLGDAPFYCDPLDIDSISDAIRRAVGDEVTRDESVRVGFQQVAKYSWEKTARETLDLYREVLGVQ